MRLFVPVVALSVFAATACVPDVGEGKVKAEVAEPPAPAEAPAEAPPKAAGNELAVDVAQSSIGALGAKVTATHPISWSKWSGSVAVDGANVTAVSFDVDMASMEADHPKLTSHLKNEDFFNIEKFPNATFKSAEVKSGSDAGGDWTHTVSGDFTIHGQTKRITFPAIINVEDAKVSANTEFTINRQDFGISYPGMADDAIQDNVVMTVKFVAPRG